MTSHPLLRLTTLLFASLTLLACSGNELVGVHIVLQKDGSGTVTTRSLVTPPTPGPAETITQGATWTRRAAIQASQGTFRRLDDLKFGDGGLRFAANLGGDQPSVRVYLERGADIAWVTSLVQDRATRRKLAKVYDPTGRTREVGDVIRLELELPGEVIASSVLPTARGVEADRERKRAYLLLPARTMLEAGDDMIWDITWR